ncbi:MAG: hypothetical protein OQL09_06760 [Gammaproteobacteria bacterium]|nr:hypothetical protein [Gammaproteobacteria bacterium]
MFIWSANNTDTKFYDNSEPEVLLADHQAFIDITTPDSSVIKIKDKFDEANQNFDGIADEVEPETP